MLPFKVLVVEDHEPFCRLICSMVQKADLHVVGQAADGSEAVQKAEELRPDLILLDIGLPKMSGIEVARRLRETVPNTKILFLSQESSSDIVQETLNLGALGYVHKPDIHRELLSAIESVRAGKQFVSSGIKDYELTAGTNIQAPHCHEVFFYSDEEVLLDGLTRFVADALKAGNPAIVVVTEPHRENIIQRLKKEGVAVDAAMQQGTCVWFGIDDKHDPVGLLDTIKSSMEAAFKASKTDHPRLALCGERSGLLWAEGQTDEALQLEQMCNTLERKCEIDILCAYPLASYGDESERAFKKISAEHTATHYR